MMSPQHTRARNHLKRGAKIAPAIAAVLLLAACASGSPTKSGATSHASASTNATGAGSGKGASIVIIGGPLSDPFFSVVKHGVDAATTAVQASGGKVTYLALANYNNLGADTAKLLQTAKNQHPDAIIFADWIPTAEEPVAKDIVASGIPVIIYNSGDMTNVKNVGALTYIGTDLRASGVAGGQEFVKHGTKDVVFINTQPGDASAEATATGYKEAVTGAGGQFRELGLPASSFGSPTAVTQAVKSELLKYPDITGVATYGAQDADSAYSAIQQSNSASKVKLMGFNLSTNSLARIKAGTQLGTIDQQGYAQGYYTVSAAYQYAAYGISLPTSPILTGPAVIDSSDVAKAISGTAAGVR
jgi:simple sugar transport system substrate-binding protein